LGKNDVEIKVVLKGKAAKQYTKSMDAIRSENRKVVSSMGKVKKSSISSFDSAKRSAMGFKAVIAGIAAFAVGKLAQSFIKAGSEVEDLTTEFKVLLGTVEAAKERMVELEKFAQTTPFQLAEVAKASKILETFTQGALSTGDALRVVGDAAAITAEKDFAGLAMWVGRAYDGLQNNRPVGEAMMRLQELALVSGKARAKIEALQKAGQGKKAWTVLENQLKKAKGGMKELSKTATGLSSTIKDQISASMRQMMDSGVWDAWKEVLNGVVRAMNNALQDGTFERWGRNVANITDGILDIAQAMGIIEKQIKGEGFLNNKSEIKNVRKLINELELLKSEHKAIGEVMKEPSTSFSTVNKLSKQSLHTYENIESVTKRINSVTGEWFKKQEEVGFSTGEILDQLNVADSKLMGIRKKGSADILTPDTTKKKSAKEKGSADILTPDTTKKKSAKEKGTLIDFAEIQAKKEEERQTELVAQIEHESALLALKEQNQQTEEELVRLKFAKQAEEEEISLQNTLRRKELETATIESIDKKYRDQKKKSEDRDMKLRAAGFQMFSSLMLNNIQQMVSGYKSLEGVSKAISVTQGVQSTYVAAIEAYKSTAAIPVIGPGLAPIAAATAIAAGLMNVSKIVSAADGGMFSGPVSGYPAVLHGNEAVIPLKNGAVPVSFDGGMGGGTTVINNYYGSSGENPSLMTEPERLQMLNESNKEIGALGI